MSDIEKKLETALNRIAQLERDSANARKPAPEKPGFDPAAFARAFTADPVGTMKQMGVPVDHTTRVLVAHAMGDTAPPELKMLAQMGPQVAQQSALSSDVQALRQRLETYEARDARKATLESFKALTADKAKYPHLTKALSADPSLFDEDLAKHGGSAEEIAAQLEARQAKVAAVYAPPPASTNADPQQAQSTQSKQAPSATGLDPTPPPITATPRGLITPQEDASLKAEIIRKYTSQATP